VLLGPAQRPVKHLFDGSQRDAIVVGTNQDVESGERLIEQFWSGSVTSSSSAKWSCSLSAFRLRIFSARARPPLTILSREFVDARIDRACPLRSPLGRSPSSFSPRFGGGLFRRATGDTPVFREKEHGKA
jgi:hypothetical protein